MLNITSHQGYANQNHNEIPLHTEWLSSKEQQTTSIDEDVEKREPSCAVCGVVNWCSHYGKQYGVSSKKLRIELPSEPSISLLGVYLKKTKTLL